MLANIPSIHPDQTIESFVAAIQIKNAWPKWESLVAELFGSHNIRIGKPLFSGLTHFLQTPAGESFSSLEDFVTQHSQLAIFLPFAEAETRDKAFKKFRINKVAGMTTLFGFNDSEPFRNERWYCEHCIKEEFQTIGYAYTHRTHQIIGVSTCPIHNAPIGPLDISDPNIFHYHGLVVSTTDCNLSPRINNADQHTVFTSQSCFSQWVYAAYENALPDISTSLRCQVILSKVSDLPRKPGVPASYPRRLECFLDSHYGAQFLDQLFLAFSHGPTSHWPSMFVSGHAYRSHALANLLLLNSLFESPAEYLKSLQRQAVSTIEPPAHSAAQLRTRIVWTLALIKDLLREPSLRKIAKKHSIGYESLQTYLESNPEFNSRRKQAVHRARFRKNKRIILAFIEDTPNANRNTLCNYSRASYKWMMKHYPTWLDSFLPTKHIKKKQHSEGCPSSVDVNTAQQLKDFYARHIESSDPAWITKMLLRSKVEIKYQSALMAGDLPETVKIIDALAESLKEYQNRILKQIGECARNGSISKCQRHVAELVTKFPQRTDLIKEIVSILLSTQTLISSPTVMYTYQPTTQKQSAAQQTTREQREIMTY